MRDRDVERNGRRRDREHFKTIAQDEQYVRAPGRENFRCAGEGRAHSRRHFGLSAGRFRKRDPGGYRPVFAKDFVDGTACGLRQVRTTNKQAVVERRRRGHPVENRPADAEIRAADGNGEYGSHAPRSLIPASLIHTPRHHAIIDQDQTWEKRP
jgi:hypothetical protein